MKKSAYDLLKDDEKTTLSAPGSIVLSFGKGLGIRTVIHWNRIGALFSSHRPILAALKVFEASKPHFPIPLRRTKQLWTPNHLHSEWLGARIRISEEKYVTKTSIVASIKIRNEDKKPRELILFFHGGVRQWQFFDYYENELPPEVSVSINAAAGEIKILQPHRFKGLPDLESEQTITVNSRLCAAGFFLDEGDLDELLETYGCKASLRLRAGQIGARFDINSSESLTYKHKSPQYYFSLPVRIEPRKTREVVLRSVYKVKGIGAGFFEKDENLRAKPESAISKEETQWKDYFELKTPKLRSDDKAIERFWNYVWYILKANRSDGGAHIKHSFTSPSKHFYWGVWIWDTYFHVLGERWLRNPEVARNSIKAVLGMQAPNGYIPCCSGVDYRMLFAGEEGIRYVLADITNYREEAEPDKASFRFRTNFGKGKRQTMVSEELTQTPLIACAAFDYAELQDDWPFAREVFPRLLAYEEWIWRRRTDEKGRFIGWHGIESGWDDATRHYPVPFKAVDMTVHAYRHRRDLALMAERLGKKRLSEELWARVRLTAQGIQSFWDNEKGCFLDKDGKNKLRPQISASTFFPMWVRLASKKQAERLVTLLKSKEFATRFPVPTLATSDPDYNPHGWGWNGTVWLQVNWFIIEGLFNYGYFREAMELWERTRELIIKDAKPASCELYDPEYGTGIGAPDYSWQALVNDFIITRIVGLRKNFQGLTLAPLLPAGMSEIAVDSIPIGRALLSISVQESAKQMAITIQSTKTRELTLRLWKKKMLEKVRINGKEVRIEDHTNAYTSRIQVKEKSEVIANWR